MSHKCSCCSKITEPHLLLKCCVCQKIFHHACVGLSSSETRLINSKKSVSWTCNRCDQMGNDINSLKAAIVSLQNEIKSIASKESKDTVGDSQFEEIVQEVVERQNRRNNIIIFGMEEQTNLTKEDRINAEKADVSRIFTHLIPNIKTMSNVRRLGKYDAGRSTPRPVKVTLASSEQVFALLKKSGSLKENDMYKHIYLATDQTPRQIQYYKKIKMELNRRIEDGEENIKIKHVNGVPKIINF